MGFCLFRFSASASATGASFAENFLYAEMLAVSYHFPDSTDIAGHHRMTGFSLMGFFPTGFFAH